MLQSGLALGIAVVAESAVLDPIALPELFSMRARAASACSRSRPASMRASLQLAGLVVQVEEDGVGRDVRLGAGQDRVAQRLAPRWSGG